MDTDLYLFPYGNGSKANQQILEQEARTTYNEYSEEPLSTKKLIRAYEQEFGALAQLQPQERMPYKQTTSLYEYIPTTLLPGLTR